MLISKGKCHFQGPSTLLSERILVMNAASQESFQSKHIPHPCHKSSLTPIEVSVFYRVVKSQSTPGLDSGLQSVFYRSRNWPGTDGSIGGIGREGAAAVLRLGTDSRRVHKSERFTNVT